MFKSRATKAVITPHSFIIGENYSDVINTRNLEWLRECYSAEPNIHTLYERMKAGDYFKNPQNDITLKTTVDLLEDEDEDNTNPEFMVTAPAILLYYHLIENKIPQLLVGVIGSYVSHFMIPKTLYVNEFKESVKKYICRKKHGKIFCPIESEEIKVGRTVCELPCGHQFTSRGIRRWLTKNQGCCPMCRHQVRTKDQEDTLIVGISHSILETHYDGIHKMLIR